MLDLWSYFFVFFLEKNIGFIIKIQMSRGCVRQNKNPADFKIVKQSLLVQKQTLHQQKGLDLSYLEPGGQGRGSIMGA